MKKVYKGRKAQTAIEYMLLLGVVVALVLVAFKTSLPRLRTSANIYFNRAEISLLGKPNPCGDGYCCSYFEDQNKCPVDCPGGINACPPEPTVNSCTGPGNIPIAHGGSYIYYQTSVVPCADTCSSQVRVCDNGNLSGSYTATSCFPACGPVCGFNGCELGETCGTCPTDCGACPLNCPAAPGGPLAHGFSRTYYLTSSVPCGDSCVSESRTCNDGTLSGSYTNTGCSVVGCPLDCPTAPGGFLAHGQSRTYYQSTAIPCGNSCQSQVRTCNNGSLPGTYTNTALCTPYCHSTLYVIDPGPMNSGQCCLDFGCNTMGDDFQDAVNQNNDCGTRVFSYGVDMWFANQTPSPIQCWQGSGIRVDMLWRRVSCLPCGNNVCDSIETTQSCPADC